MLGLVAGALTTAAWLPQLLRTWRRRSADDISWSYLLTFGAGIAAWIAYGIHGDDGPLLLANVVTMVLLLGLVGLKVHVARPVRPRSARR